MYAIIRAGGKQQKVAPGDVIEIERLKGAGKTVEFTPILVVDDEGRVNAGASALDKAKVTGEVLGESKGDKIQVLKFRNKSGYRRRAGHRQLYTTVQISDVAVGGDAAKKTAAKKTEAKKAETKKTEAKKATPKKTAAKKTAAKKPTARKAAAKKTEAKKATPKKTAAKKTAATKTSGRSKSSENEE